MSEKQGKGRRNGNLLPGLLFISTGFLAGFYGIDYALSSAEQSGKADRVASLDHLVTASIGNGKIERIRDTVASFLSGSDYLTSPKAATAPRAPAGAAVNRGLKSDRTEAEASASAGKTPQSVARIDVPLRASEPGVPARPKPSAVVAASQPSAGVAAARPAAAAQPLAAPKVASADSHLVPSRSLDVQAPYADAAEVALFAADMPLPANLTAYKPGSGVGEPSAGKGTYFSPLIPRTFANGKAFGGLGEEEFQRRERRCLVTALYFEARSEPDEGQIAVAQVIMNRVKSPDYPDTICGVVYQGSQRNTGCQFSFTCDGRADRPQNQAEWDRSVRLANLVLEGKVWLPEIGVSTHYHANYVNPRWRRSMARIDKVGRHIFYKSPEVSITAPYPRVGDEKRS
jgi:hypothetical protein